MAEEENKKKVELFFDILEGLYIKTVLFCEKIEKNDQNCGICLVDFEQNENLKILECYKVNEEKDSQTTHIFHPSCI